MLVYGNPGVGKTVLAGSADVVPEMRPVLFLDVEGGTLSLRDRYPEVEVVRVQSWNDIQKVYDALFNRQTEYKTVVVDSLTEIQKFSMYTIMDFVVRKDPDRDPDVPSMREWGKNIEQIRKLVRAFRDLPINTIFTALEKSEKDTRTGVVSIKPYLSGKLADEVAGFMDIVSYQYTKVQDGEVKRLLLTSATEKQVAKDRTGRLPIVLEEPNMDKIYDVILRQEGE